MQSVWPEEAAIWIADKLAKRGQKWLARRSTKLNGASMPASAIAQLVSQSAGASSPAWERLTEIAKELKAGVAHP